MDLKDKIKVMQHFAEGGKIERSFVDRTDWRPIDAPVWNWRDYNYRIQPPKTKQPLTAADFPPGTVIRCSGIVNWAMVLVTSPSYISVSFEYQISYERLMVGQWQYSTDQGKTWLPCYKEV